MNSNTFEIKQDIYIGKKDNTRMSLESYQDNNIKQQNEIKNKESLLCLHCKEKDEIINSLKSRIEEKDEIINSLKSRIEELEIDSNVKSQDIKKLQKDVQSLFDIIVKKGIDVDNDDSVPTKITVTTEEYEDNVYYNEINKPIEENRLSVESISQYNDDIKDSYSDSAIDLFTDDDDDSSSAGSIKTDGYDDRPSEWLDVSPTLKQRAKIDKRNLDRWNYKMANNGLLPIRLVGKVDEEREKKIQTHQKRHSTSAIWLKTYESNKKKQDQVPDDTFKIPSFNFSKYAFSTTNPDDTKSKSKESKEVSAPISLKSSVSTLVSELSTTSIATTSLQSYENTSMNFSKSQQMLSQYK